MWPELCGPEDVSFRQSQIQFETDTRTIQFGLNVLKVSHCLAVLTGRLHSITAASSIGV